jgi:hypothetical protein
MVSIGLVVPASNRGAISPLGEACARARRRALGRERAQLLGPHGVSVPFSRSFAGQSGPAVRGLQGRWRDMPSNPQGRRLSRRWLGGHIV